MQENERISFFGHSEKLKKSLKKSNEEVAVVIDIQATHIGRAVWSLDAFTVAFTFPPSSFQGLNLFVASDSEFISVELNLSASDRHHPLFVLLLVLLTPCQAGRAETSHRVTN